LSPPDTYTATSLGFADVPPWNLKPETLTLLAVILSRPVIVGFSPGYAASVMPLRENVSPSGYVPART